ncbi:TerB [Roseibium sp. TrichSKD4]|uniref:tellurite resistance TerB family protein n=1 Tax=Roseibium sp. TrichSKD4 TaxID=744980 RepID=UPI0001E56BD5|nr:TerB family tellurite resistance protein [Roseibium sp. TrichSKD4]EFO30145.1 TerB [Roseibium sp. TrichSKD4]
MLGKLKQKLEGSMNRFKGKTDFLEAVCAAAALVAAADGEIEDAEIKATIQGISSNPVLAGAFPSRQIEQTLEQMFERTKGRAGRMGLYGEIDDIKDDPEMAETVYLTALDISESDGQIEPEEKAVLEKIAAKLGLNPANYDV